MKKQDGGVICVLILLGVFIWLRDLRWLDGAADTTPILLGLPLFVWLKRPWTFAEGQWRLAPRPLILAATLFAGGLLLDSTLLLTGSWIALLWSWISVRGGEGKDSATSKLLVLPFFSFPWITTDLEGVGWWFRLSGAAVVERMLAWCQFDVIRQGTYLSISGLSLSVEPACSGINGLQSMLIAGTALACMKLRHSRWYWWNLPLLVAAAWTANVIRILVAALAGLGLERETALHWLGPLHMLAGWVALCAMFGVCWFLFSVEERLGNPGLHVLAKWFARKPWLEMVLLGYCVFRCGSLVGTWLHSPFDQLGWLAFLIWLLPIAISRQVADVFPLASENRKLCFMGLGLVFTLIGDAGDLNLGRHLGLALVLMGFARRDWPVVWNASAVAWLPASGWVGSRLGVDPDAVATLRVLMAVAACAWVLLEGRRRNAGASGRNGPEFQSLPATRTASPSRPGRFMLGLGVPSVILLGALWGFYPLPDARERLAEIPQRGARFVGRDLPLTERERAILRDVSVRHLRYRVDGRDFFLTMIDGTKNRHAVHDPRYCFQGAGWRLVAERQLRVPGGEATWLKSVRGDHQAEVLFWFSDGESRYSSLPRYWWETTLRRMTFGRFGAEPVLVVLQSYGGDQPNWSESLKESIVALRL